MTEYESKLSAMLYRALCPSTTELGEYRFGMLDGEQINLIQQHINTCIHCSREMTQLDDYLAKVSLDLEYSIMDRVNIWIARLIPEQNFGNLAPLTNGLRGKSDQQRNYQAGEAQLTFDVQEDPEQPDRKIVIGLVTGVEVIGIKVRLWREEKLIIETEVDELGNYLISGLEIGSYRLILSGTNFEIHIEELEI